MTLIAADAAHAQKDDASSAANFGYRTWAVMVVTYGFGAARYGNVELNAESFATQSVVTLPPVINPSSISITSSARRRPFGNPAGLVVSTVELAGSRDLINPPGPFAPEAVRTP